jgi:hypothetical protein
MRRLDFWLTACAVALATQVAPQRTWAQEPLEEIKRLIATLPADFLDLTDIELVTSGAGGITATATTMLMGARTDVLLATRGGATRGYLIGLRPDDWSLAKALPQLANPALDGLTLSNVGLVIAGADGERSSRDMAGGEYAFFQSLIGADDFTVTLRAGVNLLAAIPVETLAADHPLVGIMDALGIERGVVRLQGALGPSLTLLTQPGSGGLAAIKDLFLRAELPPMRPKGSPEWFRSGQLALEITGEPSLRLAGEMTVRIQEDELEFFLAAALARSGVSLSGGLEADRGWEGPFGIDWMTLNRVVLKIGITPIGSVQLGFAGDLVIGKKDMQVAVAVAVSPALVPTNFIFSGASEAGFGLSDLVEMQTKMAAARSAATGEPVAPAIPLDALPQVEFRGVALKFAPRPEPDLGVEQGMAIKGKLLLPVGQGGSLSEVASVDVNVGDDGLWVRGKLGAFQVGPLTWQDAELDLTATREVQLLKVNGDVQLGATRQKVDLEFTRTNLRFNTVTELFGLFRAEINAQAALNLMQPSFAVHAVAQNDFGEVLGPIVRDGAIRFAGVGRVVLTGADAAITGVQGALGIASATADQLRTQLEATRQNAQNTVNNAQQELTRLRRLVNTARAERDRAYALWEATPLRQLSLRASRRNAWVREVAQYHAAAATYTAQSVVVNAAQRILAALPPVDQNILLMAADQAVAALRRQLQVAEANLATIRDQYEAVILALDRGENLLTITRAEVSASLESLMQGASLAWSVNGTFVGNPFTIQETLNFQAPYEAAGAMLTRLVTR